VRRNKWREEAEAEGCERLPLFLRPLVDSSVGSWARPAAANPPPLKERVAEQRKGASWRAVSTRVWFLLGAFAAVGGRFCRSARASPRQPAHLLPPARDQRELTQRPHSPLDRVFSIVLLGLGGTVALLGVEATAEMARSTLDQFLVTVRAAGSAGRVLYIAAYAGVELLLLPATPLALTAAALFGFWPGVALSSLGGLGGATSAFLLGRYVARERVLAATVSVPQFKAIDRAISRDGLKVVLLVNLSPLAGIQNLLNYAYGTTSVALAPYMAGSWLASLPRTYATVLAGSLGATLLEGEEDAGHSRLAVVGALAAMAATLAVAQLAKEALAEAEEDT